MLDRERFKSATARAISDSPDLFSGIGTLSEKVMHRAIKLYIEPDVTRHEIELSGSVADIYNGEGIFEIQRRAFSYLKPKLKKFLPEYPVTVVHPIVARKRVRWLDRESGEIVSTKRSIKGKTVYDSAYELYQLREFIGRAGFRVRILMLECDEYRALDGYGADRKKRASVLECIPTDILDEIELLSISDYGIFLPEGLPREFSSRDFLRLSRSRSRYSYYSLRLLCELGLLSRKKVGRAFIYRKED